MLFHAGLSSPRRRLHVGPVEGDPQLLVAPDLGEGLVHPRVLPVVPDRLVLVDLHHAAAGDRRGPLLAGVGLVAVPVLGVVRIDLEELPDGLHEAVQVLLGDGVGHDDVAVLLPEGAI